MFRNVWRRFITIPAVDMMTLFRRAFLTSGVLFGLTYLVMHRKNFLCSLR